VSVVTRRPGAGSDVPDRSTGMIAAHTGVSTGYRAMTHSGATSFTFTSMFPFETPYEVYSGDCTTNNPATFTGLENYFATNTLAVADVDPGTAGPARTVLEPAIDVTVTYNGSPASDARIYAYSRTPDCSTDDRILLGETNSTGKIPAGTDAGPGLPFGTYDICAQLTRRVNWSNRTWRIHWSSSSGNSGPAITNTAVAGTARTAAFVSSASSTGGCQDDTPTS